MKRLTVLIPLVVIMLVYKVQAQQWQVITSFPGRPAMGSYSGTGAGTWYGLMDFDGDGVQEMSFTLDGKGTGVNVEQLTIVSGADPSQVWEIPLPDSIIASGNKFKFVGFFNFDGTTTETTDITVNAMNKKEMAAKLAAVGRPDDLIIFYNIDTIAGTYEVKIWDGGTILIGGWDVDNNETSELIIYDPNKNEVQVWGLR